MKPKQSWTVLSFFTCFLLNAALVALFYFTAQQVVYGLQQWVTPFLQVEGLNLPEDVSLAFQSLSQFIADMEKYLAPAIFGVGGVITFILWLFVMLQGRRLANRVSQETAAALPLETAPREEKKPEKKEPAPEQFVQPSPQAAVQMLAILQREGRLIDFLQEDLSLYEDAQIGAAVRNIHQGCKEALSQYVDLKPVFSQAEGEEVTVEPGFDSTAVRLTGNVAGDPPFRGVLRHRGWRVSRVELPMPISEQKKELIVAPAEVEIS